MQIYGIKEDRIVMNDLLFNPLYQGLFTVAFMLLLLLIFRVTGKPIVGWNSTVLISLLFLFEKCRD